MGLSKEPLRTPTCQGSHVLHGFGQPKEASKRLKAQKVPGLTRSRPMCWTVSMTNNFADTYMAITESRGQASLELTQASNAYQKHVSIENILTLDSRQSSALTHFQAQAQVLYLALYKAEALVEVLDEVLEMLAGIGQETELEDARPRYVVRHDRRIEGYGTREVWYIWDNYKDDYATCAHGDYNLLWRTREGAEAEARIMNKREAENG